MRYFFHIAYDGSPYSGWQRQPNSFTVQEAIEEKLERIFKQKVVVLGCGRTDKGVHSSQYFFHVNFDEELTIDLEFILRKHLPKSITLFEIIPVEINQHARYEASSRSYDYFLHTEEDPYIEKYSTLISKEGLDLSLMMKAAELIKRYNDFRAFCLQPDVHNHTRCEITNAQLLVNPQGTRIRFAITGNRFLKGMIRILVASILKVGRGEMTIAEFEERFKTPKNTPDLKSAAPNGLYLSRIEYPFLKRENNSLFFQNLKQGLED